MSLLVHVLMVGIALGIHFWLRQREDLRARLGWKVHLSHALLVFAVFGCGANLAEAWTMEAIASVGTMGSIIGLGFLWTPEISSEVAQSVTQVLFGDGYAGGGFQPDYNAARAAMAASDFESAVTLIRAELAKDPRSFEGLWLLAKTQMELKQFDRALAQLELILARPETTDEQREAVRAEMANCSWRQAGSPTGTLSIHANQ